MQDYKWIFFYSSSLLLITIALTSCMLGPDFSSPTPPAVHSYTKQPPPKNTVASPKNKHSGKAQYFNIGATVPDEWWTLFHSKAINALIDRGMQHSPTVDAAKATLRQARENLRSQIGTSLYPSVTLPISGQREREQGDPPTTTPSALFNLFNASINVSYNLDLFGGYRRQVEASRALVDYQFYELEAAYLTLTSSIATTAVMEASLRAQIQATKNLIALNEKQLKVIKKQFELGAAASSDVIQQQSQLDQTIATLPPLQASLAETQDLLAILVGELPSESRPAPITLSQLTLPTKLPITLPSYLVKQRPDIRAAEALLHQSSALIGVATANLFPEININGFYGSYGTSVGQWFISQGTMWNYGVNVTQSIFQGGALMAQRRAAIAAYQQNLAQYKQTVLQAFQNVADTLYTLQYAAKTLRAQAEAENDAYKALYVAKKQYAIGTVNYLSVLILERQYQQAVISRIQAEADRYTKTVALFQALGGGWWTNRIACEASHDR